MSSRFDHDMHSEYLDSLGDFDVEELLPDILDKNTIKVLEKGQSAVLDIKKDKHKMKMFHESSNQMLHWFQDFNEQLN